MMLNLSFENILLKKLIFVLLLYLFIGNVPIIALGDSFKVQFSTKPEHAILYIIDGLSYKIWDRVDLPVLKGMIESGALVEKNYLPPSAHPTQGAYADLHTCSIPNPVMMAGTVFITKRTEYLPQKFFPEMTTAFVANTEVYSSLNRYYHYSYQKLGPDSEGVDMAMDFMKMGRPAFMRVHLQEVGEASFQIMRLTEDVPWRGNIWAKGSPYLKMLKKADSLLGDFLRELEKQSVLSKTVILVMGDHGETDIGYHPPQIIDASITSIVLWGAGIKKGVRIPYSEQIDVVPTICALMDKEPPETCQGRVIAEALSEYKGEALPRKKLFKRMLVQFEEYRKKGAETSYMLESFSSPRISLLYRNFNNINKDFYDIQRFSEWPRFKTVEELLENNRKALNRLDVLLDEIRKIK